MSYIRIGTDTQNYTLQTVDLDSSIDSSLTLIGLTRGQYQFSVVAFTSEGPGDIDSVKVSTVPSKLIIYVIIKLTVVSSAPEKVEHLLS